MKKLLLINPWIYDFSAYDLWSKPLGLLYLASFLRRFDYEIYFVDCLDKYLERQADQIKIKKYGVGPFPRRVVDKPEIVRHIPRHFARYGISEETFIRRLIKYQDADAVLLTSLMTYWYPGVRRAAELVREYLPGKPLILGGIYATLLPQHAREVVKPDYLISGPGEIKTLQLLARLFGREVDSDLLPKTIDDYPPPAFDLISHPDYLPLLTSRGCPFDCSFCAQKKISMPYVRRNPELVVREIAEQQRKFKVRDFAIYDDALFINKERHIEVILREVIKKRLKVRFHSPNGLFARYIDRKLACLMHQANFKTVRLSFETSNEQRGRDMYSKVNNADMVRAVQNLTGAGYAAKELEAYVMMGLPGQSVEEVIASILFVHNLGVQVRLASFSPIHGTREFDKAVLQGRIAEDIDPLLTNKSIFPLRDETITYEKYRKIRTFSQILNEALKKDLPLFTDPLLGETVRKVVGQIE